MAVVYNMYKSTFLKFIMKENGGEKPVSVKCTAVFHPFAGICTVVVGVLCRVYGAMSCKCAF